MRKKLTIPYLWSAFLMHNTWFSHWLPDKLYLKMLFGGYVGYPLNLEHPATFNEKLQWLKLYDRKPIYTTMVDKYEVKKYVADIIGDEYIIPTLGVWDKFEDIDFDKLPNQFVLKTTHDSGGVVVCRDKSAFNKELTRKKLKKSLKTYFYYQGREWPYRNVPPRIIAEKYMQDKDIPDLRDYKFFCFSGKPKFLFIASDRHNPTEETKFDFFDMDFRHLPFTNGHPNAKTLPQKPKNFEQMKQLAAILSEGIPHVRVDFYEINGKIYFGELTFFHWGGFVPFEPGKWDKIIGEWVDLSEKGNDL